MARRVAPTVAYHRKATSVRLRSGCRGISRWGAGLEPRARTAGAVALMFSVATEREAILGALHESNWVLGGPHGAATRLGLERTTLPLAHMEAGHRSTV